jgi:hypothetical protein
MANRLPPFGSDVVVDEQWCEPTTPAGGYNDDAPVVPLDFSLGPRPTSVYLPARVSDVLAHDTAHRRSAARPS